MNCRKKIINFLSVLFSCIFVATIFFSCAKGESSTQFYTIIVENGTGGGTFKENSEITITATLSEEQVFVGWQLGTEIVSTENPYTFFVVEDKVYTALSEDKVHKLELVRFDNTEIDICDKTVRKYLENKAQPNILAAMLMEEKTNALSLDKQNIAFSWQDDYNNSPYKVSFADNSEFNNEYVISTTEKSLSDVGIFTPGKTYYWKVSDSIGNKTATDTFTIKDTPIRWISAGNITNVRDCGGWTTADGNKIKYNLLYRGGSADNSATGYANEKDKEIFNYLGINGEIDLRIGSTQTENFLDANKPFINKGINYFYQIVPEEYDYSVSVSDAIGDIFEFLANKDNYPIYYHCSWGKDRTGTLGVLISGLLGVEYDALMCDYELSSYARMIETQNRNEIVLENGEYKFVDASEDVWGAVGRLYYVLFEKYGNGDPHQPFSEVVEKYLKDICGVSDEEITMFKSIMLETK